MSQKLPILYAHCERAAFKMQFYDMFFAGRQPMALHEHLFFKVSRVAAAAASSWQEHGRFDTSATKSCKEQMYLVCYFYSTQKLICSRAFTRHFWCIHNFGGFFPWKKICGSWADIKVKRSFFSWRRHAVRRYFISRYNSPVTVLHFKQQSCPSSTVLAVRC